MRNALMETGRLIALAAILALLLPFILAVIGISCAGAIAAGLLRDWP
jgi:hypothetical protein